MKSFCDYESSLRSLSMNWLCVVNAAPSEPASVYHRAFTWLVWIFFFYNLYRAFEKATCVKHLPQHEKFMNPLSHKIPHLITNKPYIVIVLCLLVTLNQWKQFNLLFPGTTCITFLLRGIFGVSMWECPLALGWRFTTDHRTVLHWKISMTITAFA